MRLASHRSHAMDSHIAAITKAIQLAIAPAFLLTAIATIITLLINRLGRIVDRRRVVLARPQADCDTAALHERGAELLQLAKRARLIYLAVLFAVVSALCVCLVVACVFLDVLMTVDLSRMVAVEFIVAMLCITAALGLFLREVFRAVRSATHNYL